MANERKKFDFIGNRKIYFIISGCLAAVILLCSLIFGVRLDIQFKGGTLVNYTYTGSIQADAIRAEAEKAIGTAVSVNMKDALQGENSFEVVLVEDKGLSAEAQEGLTTALEERFAENQIALLSNNSVDPVIGREFFAKSMVAVSFAALVLVLYIALRFRLISGWSAGVMAIVALINDLITVFGVFVIFRIPLDYNFIAVLLTILGYSVNDTIVIYDRIRENRRLYGDRLDRHALVNNSINETLSRTINTTITTLTAMVVVSIVALIMGVESILSFAFPMAIGLISGTYTTICLTGPLWVTWQDYKEKKGIGTGKKHA